MIDASKNELSDQTCDPGHVHPAPHAMTRQEAGRVAAMTLTVLALVGLAWLLIELTQFLLLVFAALVLAAVFSSLARRVCGWTGMRRGPALAISVFLLLAVFAGAFTLFGSQISSEFDTIQQSIPPAIDRVEAQLDEFGLGEQARQVVRQGTGDLSSLASRLGGFAMTATNGIANFVLVFVGAIFIASDPNVYRRGLLLLLPARAEPPMGAALDDASRGLRGWMMGQAVSSVVVSLLTGGGLWALGVPASGGLGIIAGLLDVIPMVGPVIAGIPAVLLAFTVSPTAALWTVGLFLLVQQIQGNFLQPMIQKQAVDVPPAVLLFAVVAAGLVFGFMGVLLSAPLTVVTYVMIQRLYVKTLLAKPIRIAGQD
ncbi:putative PurR-regulated permease PerM [Blastomonas natatoria]|uniref:Putative PurR-regulated permease PerM n=1 Tax=Blastomonas natatoria TaxID=34015 RepID=A0A2V3VBN2_9SPHN|nr:AI-2E family transporter [Blastomonas natatoria]PXW78148.1 putative PurR-regulated permease PerM [Blastomonas natatoria]